MNDNQKKQAYKKALKIKRQKLEVLDAINSNQEFVKFLQKIQKSSSSMPSVKNEITAEDDQLIRNHIEDYRNIVSYLSLSGKAYFFNIFQLVKEYCKNEKSSSRAVILPRDLKKFHSNLITLR